MRSGGTVSSVAWKAFNFNFIKKIKKLRKNYGDFGIEAHLEMIIRMSVRLGVIDWAGFNEDDKSSYQVTISYPPFFEPTADEKLTELKLIREADLPIKIECERVAMLMGIKNEETIQEMITIKQEKIDQEEENLNRIAQGNILGRGL
jgi:hypothetical protein